jgi:16S rRNA processing protein RimM
VNGSETVVVGRVIRPHGIRGELKVSLPESFEAEGFDLQVKTATGVRTLIVEAVRGTESNPILKFKGVDDRNEAESLKGAILSVPKSRSPKLAEDEHFISELIGLNVQTSDGRVIGKIEDVWDRPGQDIIVVRSGEKEILIPSVKAFIKSIRPEKGIMIVEPIEGLLD